MIRNSDVRIYSGFLLGGKFLFPFVDFFGFVLFLFVCLFVFGMSRRDEILCDTGVEKNPGTFFLVHLLQLGLTLKK